MVGIYRFYNKESGKSYIGLTNNLERRKKEHLQKTTEQSGILFDDILHKNREKFEYEVLERCEVVNLQERERYWIAYYDSFNNGYNMTPGGDLHSVGSSNGRAKLTEEDVFQIREEYRKRERPSTEVRKDYPQISGSTFEGIWQGKYWTHVHMEVYDEESLRYYSFEATNGEKSPLAILSDQEVIEIRHRYVNETAREIYKDFSHRMGFQTLQQTLWGRRYKHLPIYSKKKKRWIDPK